MLRAKIALIYTAIAILSGSFLVWLASLFGWIALDSTQANAAIIGPLLGVLVAAVNAKHIFDDPEAILKLKQEHADAMLQRDKNDANAEIQRHKAALQFQEKNEARIKHLESEVSRWQQTALSNQNRPRTISARPVPPIAPGNATTQK